MGLWARITGRDKPTPTTTIVKREYAAAQRVARYADLGTSRGSADYELREGLAEVRAKTRYLARNSSTMRRYLSLLKVNVIGPEGFRFKSRVKSSDGVTMATALNARVEAAWREWWENPTVEGVMTGAALLQQAAQTWGRDGEVIWEIVTGGAYRHGIAINPVEADHLDETLNTVHPPTKNQIIMGVEIDDRNRPVAYHLLTTHPGALVWTDFNTQRRYRRVPADRIVHLYERLRPGQTRGEPPAASIVLATKMLDGYREAETMGRRLRAALMGFFQRAMPGSSQIDELSDREDEDDALFEMDMEPGRLKQLPDGLEFKEFSPGGSVTDYADFESQIKKDQSMGLGISTMSLGMEVSGVSYSSGRTIVIEDRDHYKTLQGFFIDGLMKRIYPKWVMAHSLVPDAAFTPTQMARVMRSYRFRPRGWDWVDPSKDVAANIEALRTYQTSLTKIAADRGMDRDELLDEIADDMEALKNRGLMLSFDGDTPSQGENTDDDASE